MTYKIVKSITALYLITALAMSFSHIAALFGLMGSDWQRWIAPLMIDTVAVIGKLSTASGLNAKTRRIGKRALIIAGTVSLIANVTVGYVEEKYGNAILGAIVVAGALWAEWHLSNLKIKAVRPRRAATTRKPAGKPVRKVDPVRSAAARKAAVTRKANAAKIDAELAAITG